MWQGSSSSRSRFQEHLTGEQLYRTIYMNGKGGKPFTGGQDEIVGICGDDRRDRRS